MSEKLVLACIVAPILGAVLVFLLRVSAVRALIVMATSSLLIVSSVLLAKGGGFEMPAATMFGLNVEHTVLILDFALMGVIFLIGLRIANWKVIALAAAQIVGMLYVQGLFDVLKVGQAVSPPMLPVNGLFVDNLSIIMVLVISVVGSLICIYGLGYMGGHEQHLKIEKSRQPRFFFFMLLFLGAMNGLVMSNNLLWLFFFWELTTLCSFMLIGHDGTAIAKKNASRALWMNMLGGAAFVFALMMLKSGNVPLSLQSLMGSRDGIFLLPIILLCFAGFTKSAQVPFQSWLTGAMVAPTPVSALLHSSTMVKAGVFIILRLAPGYTNTWFSLVLALFGAFTFIATSALAVGQSNGKKVLAYSTIANLGLIIACAGMNSQAAITAAIFIIVFHAISKALLFLCVGAIEQRIESRNVDDMRSLYKVMPRTAIIMALGIITMMLPPFGMLLGKWMAIEASLSLNFAMPLVAVMLALGSALTVLFWGRWAGILLGTDTPAPVKVSEGQPSSVSFTLVVLSVLAVVGSIASPLLYAAFIQNSSLLADAFPNGYDLFKTLGSFNSNAGVFSVYPLFVAMGVAFLWALAAAKKASTQKAQLPYLSGIQAVDKDGEVGFIGPMRQLVKPTMGNYYLSNIFGEEKLGATINAVAITLMALMLGVGGELWK